MNSERTTLARRYVRNQFQGTCIDMRQYSREWRGEEFYQKVGCVALICETVGLVAIVGGIAMGIAYQSPLLGLSIAVIGSTITVTAGAMTIKWLKHENEEELLTRSEIRLIINRISSNGAFYALYGATPFNILHLIELV